MGELELYYQPLINRVSGKVTAMEALLRWNHPEPRPGFSRPFSFRWPRRPGSSCALGEWVVRHGVRRGAHWPSDIKRRRQPVGHPVQGAAISCRRSWVRLARSGLVASRLELEITESVLLNDTETTRASCISFAISACASRWTISAPAIRRSAICAASRSTRSRSTAASFAISPNEGEEPRAICPADRATGNSLGDDHHGGRRRDRGATCRSCARKAARPSGWGYFLQQATAGQPHRRRSSTRCGQPDEGRGISSIF